jgi:shikimate kinase
MVGVAASLHGAISIVSAIATGKGATLGISLNVGTTVNVIEGKGEVLLESDHKNISSRLINKVVGKIIPKKELEKSKVKISIESEVPTGYGLKSSSAISSVVALACSKLFRPEWKDSEILVSGVDASMEAGVSITGAYDDACACYYGGFVVTDNYKRLIIKQERGPKNLQAVIFIPSSRKRGNVRKLKTLDKFFDHAWNLAKESDYWNAMVLNGLATSAVLNSEPKLIAKLIEYGALGASISGNGPSIAAIVKEGETSEIKKVFSSLPGKIVVSEINNKKAEVHEL